MVREFGRKNILAKRIEAGEKTAKQARVEPVALEPAPNVESETRIEEPRDAAMDGGATEGGSLRVESTRECRAL